MGCTNYFKVLRPNRAMTTRDDLYPFDGTQPAEQYAALERATGEAARETGRVVMWCTPRFGGHASIPLIGET